MSHVYQFGTFGPTAPWVYGLIVFGMFAVTFWNIYRTLSKRRRRRHKEPPAGTRIRTLGLPTDVCRERLRNGTCGFDAQVCRGPSCPEWLPQNALDSRGPGA